MTIPYEIRMTLEVLDPRRLEARASKRKGEAIIRSQAPFFMGELLNLGVRTVKWQHFPQY